MVVGSQVRAARALLKWKVDDLASRAQVSPNTVVRLEAEKGVNMATLSAIQRALEEGGVVFIPADSELGAGVRHRVQPQG